MIATAEIDKAGRLVLPKRMRDAFNLAPGTRVTIDQTDTAIVIAPELPPRGLYMDRGTLVYDAGPLPPIDTLTYLNEHRNQRADELIER